MTSFVYVTGITPEPSTIDVNTTGHADEPTVWNLWGIWGSAIDEGNPSSTMAWGATAILICLVTAIIIGAAVGLNIIGSGLSSWSQHSIFILLFFMPLWGLLTMMTLTYFFNEIYGSFGEIFYIGLTLSFTIGVAMELGNDGD